MRSLSEHKSREKYRALGAEDRAELRSLSEKQSR
jgi:hypothetical protein